MFEYFSRLKNVLNNIQIVRYPKNTYYEWTPQLTTIKMLQLDGLEEYLKINADSKRATETKEKILRAFTNSNI